MPGLRSGVFLFYWALILDKVAVRHRAFGLLATLVAAWMKSFYVRAPQAAR